MTDAVLGLFAAVNRAWRLGLTDPYLGPVVCAAAALGWTTGVVAGVWAYRAGASIFEDRDIPKGLPETLLLSLVLALSFAFASVVLTLLWVAFFYAVFFGVPTVVVWRLATWGVAARRERERVLRTPVEDLADEVEPD